MQIRGRVGQIVLLSAVLLTGAAAPVSAHFFLVAPDSWKTQGPLGDPQKVGPCGEEGGTPTGAVTAYRPGDTVAIVIDEKIFHPGHYRVALSIDDRNELPAPPVVTAVDQDPCGSVPIMDPPVFPVLADGMLPHAEPFDGPQTFTVTLPDDVTCERCTLQVVEYMSSHAVPCFYYHCADISIQNAPAPTATSTPVAAATPTATEPAASCAGDCDGGGDVAINEIYTMVAIALDRMPATTCRAGDGDNDQRITINELLAAVNSAFSGCAVAGGGHGGH